MSNASSYTTLTATGHRLPTRPRSWLGGVSIPTEAVAVEGKSVARIVTQLVLRFSNTGVAVRSMVSVRNESSRESTIWQSLVRIRMSCQMIAKESGNRVGKVRRVWTPCFQDIGIIYRRTR